MRNNAAAFQREFSKATRHVELSIDDFFDTDKAMGILGVILKAKFRGDIATGVQYLEEVTVEKVKESYKGIVNIDPQGTKRSEVSFCYEQSGKKAGTFTELRGPTGKILNGFTERQTREYIGGSVPYAVMCLERQIKQGGEPSGKFHIPRTYDNK